MFKKYFFITIFFILFILFLLFIFLFLNYKSGSLQNFVFNQVVKKVSDNSQVNFLENSDILSKVLGMEEKQTYLVLFLNNTEIRPGGGFIGSYGLIEIEKGVPHIIKTEGTEILDLTAPYFESIPPIYLKEHLKIERWMFRDSNWSPDFYHSTLQGLEFYKKELGERSDQIDGVIGITPTVLEELLKIIGPIVIDDMEFNSDNFTEKLEYEVEYGYVEKGLKSNERKDLIGILAKEILVKARNSLLTNWSSYYNLFEKLTKEKHILFYSSNEEIQNLLEIKEWAGRVKQTSGDYLLWVDANLGAWKTDASLDRHLIYKIFPTDSGRFVAEVKMEYNHKSSKDWRTSRYLSYARIYVPKGSELIEIVGGESPTGGLKDYSMDKGEELDKQWFGSTVKVPPLSNKNLIFRFYLSPKIEQQIYSGVYDLIVQKQLGTLDHKLTLDLNFDNNVLSAHPSELEENWGDYKYSFKTDLFLDRFFSIKLEKKI